MNHRSKRQIRKNRSSGAFDENDCVYQARKIRVFFSTTQLTAALSNALFLKKKLHSSAYDPPLWLHYLRERFFILNEISFST